MSDRAGSFNNTNPDWRGIIRRNSGPLYVCTHRDHSDQREATNCARNAMAFLKANGHTALPEGWLTYKTAREMGHDGCVI